MEIKIREQEAGDIAALEKMFGQLLSYHPATDSSSGNGEQIDPNSARVAQIYSTVCETASYYARTERSYLKKFVVASNGRAVGFVGYHDIYGSKPKLLRDVIVVMPELDADIQREILKEVKSFCDENVVRDSGPGY